jgi:hypothetical protein
MLKKIQKTADFQAFNQQAAYKSLLFAAWLHNRAGKRPLTRSSGYLLFRLFLTAISKRRDCVFFFSVLLILLPVDGRDRLVHLWPAQKGKDTGISFPDYF